MIARCLAGLAVLVLTFAFSIAEDAKPKKAETAQDQKAATKDDDKPLRSLVLLRKTHYAMDEAKVVAAIKKAFPKYKIGTEKTDDVMVAATELATICTFEKEELTLLINSRTTPYTTDSEKMAKEIVRKTGDKELGQAMRDHEAWFSVDILGGEPDEKNEEKQYELLSKVTAQFHDKNCTILYFPEKNKLYAANAATLKLMKQGKALNLANDGVINIENDDADLKAAIEKALKTWGDFEKAFEKKTGVNHSVKFKFNDKKSESEFMWVSVDKIEDGMIVGKLANVPNFLTNIKEGDVVKRSAKEIEDWFYIEDKKMIGGYSIKVLQDRQKKRSTEKP